MKSLFEFFPTNKMSLKRKIYATIRLVCLLSVIGFMITNNISFIVVGILTSAFLYLLYYYQTFLATPTDTNKENFTNINTQKELDTIINTTYQDGTKKNPFSNVSLTDYTDDPTRKPAPPSFNQDGFDAITSNVKKTVQFLNPTIDNTSEQLFGDLYNKFELNTSNRNFFSNPNTRIPNDQGAFANFLYGLMPSCKEDGIQCVKDNVRYNLY
jgi:Ca2+/Na+ antiporter